MVSSSLSLLAGLVAVASAKVCVNFTQPVTISSRNAVFDNFAVPLTPTDPATLALNLTRQGQNATANALTGYATISGTYNMSVQYCTPNGQKGNAVQVLTHGIGFDKTYWDLAYHNYNYSYVDYALSQGYDTFSYDRLGIGNSSHGEPRNEIQSFLEVQALAALTRQLRNGTTTGLNGNGYSKVVHIGHSFGSAQTYALVNLYPELSDAAILTGFSMNASFVGLFAAGNDFQQANLNQPFRLGNASLGMQVEEVLNYANASMNKDVLRKFHLSDLFQQPIPTTSKPLNYPSGYVINRDVNALIYLFLFPKFFDLGIAYYGESGKQPVTPGELLTLGSLTMTNNYKGPVLVFTGDHDLPYCGGDCVATGTSSPSIPAAVSKNFPNASSFEAYIQPNTGHGLTFHYNATAGYKVMNDWIKSHGVSA